MEQHRMNKMADIIKQYLASDPSLRHPPSSGGGNHEDLNSPETVTAKAVTMVCLFTASFICGILPIKLYTWFNWGTDPKSKKVVMLLLCFGGGILMCTTFLHLLPEVTEQIHMLTEDGHFPESKIHFGEFLMCIGFFVMYFVEECVHVYLSKREKTNAMNAFNRTLSIRRGELESTDEMKSSSNLVKGDEEKGKAGFNSPNHESLAHSGHSHLVIETDSVVMTIRGLLIVLALSVHELFEGLAVGLEASAATVWYMFGAVAAHKFVIAFCIGVELVTTRTKTYLTILYVFTFSVVSPLGIGIGILVSADEADSTAVVSVVLQGLATGTLLYVVYFEILQKDKIKGLKAYFAVLIGFAVMFGLTILTAHDHHGHGHSHDHEHELDDGHDHEHH